MSGKYYLFLLTLLSSLQLVAQEKMIDPYWNKTAAEKQKIAEDYKGRGIILLDSITTDKIRMFLYKKGIGVFSTDKIYSPYFYNVKELISDSSYKVGIFMFGIESSHPGKYLFFKDGDKLIFLDSYKKYQVNNSVRRILRFLKKHQSSFDKQKQIAIWRKLSEFYESFPGYVG